MKALRWHDKKNVQIDEIPCPEPGPDEVLLKVTYSGICGSEVHEYLAGPIFIPLDPHPLTGTCAPQVMGHEFGGIIEKTGKNVKDLKPGMQITVDPIFACGECHFCSLQRPSLCENLAYYGLIGDGGHGEYAVVRAENCIIMPRDVPGEYVVFGEPAGVAFHSVNQAQITEGSTVAVIGGGPIGQLVVQYARNAGAGKVYLTEIAPRRIEIAEKIGVVDEIFNPMETDITEEILKRTNGRGVDFAIECCGKSKTGILEDTGAQAVNITKTEGTTVIVGTFSQPTDIQFNNLVFMEKRIIGSWIWHSKDEYKKALELIFEGRVNPMPLISRKVSLDKSINDGIMALIYNKDDHMKIIIDMAKV